MKRRVNWAFILALAGGRDHYTQGSDLRHSAYKNFCNEPYLPDGRTRLQVALEVMNQNRGRSDRHLASSRKDRLLAFHKVENHEIQI